MTGPAESPQDAPNLRSLDSGPVRLYGGALRHLAGRLAVFLSTVALRLGRWATTETRATARNRADAARTRARAAGHPVSRPRLSVVPDGYAQGRADLQFTYPPGMWPVAPHSVYACLGTDCPTHTRKDHP